MRTGFLKSIGAVVALCSMLTIPAAAQKKGKSTERHMLWKVQSDRNVVYILGSVHALNKEMYPLAPIIDKAINEAKVYAFETDIDSIDQGTAATLMMSRGVYGGDTTLSSVLPEGLHDSVTSRIKKAGLDIAMFERFRPWVLAITIMGLELQQSELQSEYGIDIYVNRKASEAGKPTIALETADFQIGLFSGMSESGQFTLLRQALDDTQSSEEYLDKLLKAWKKGDVKTMESMMMETFTASPDFYNSAVVQRNRNWIPRIEEFLKASEPHLVVVGALHLVGEEGVINLLKQQGYRVEQL